MMLHQKTPRFNGGLILTAILFLLPCRAEKPAPDGIASYLEKASATDNSSWFARQLAAYRKFPRLDLAFRLIKEGRVSDGERELDRLLAEDPGDLKAGSVYIVVLYSAKDYQRVIRVCDNMLKVRPSFAPALIYRGLAWQTLGKSDFALRDFGLLAGLHSLNKEDRVFALDTLTDLALGQKHYDQALKATASLAVYKHDARLFYREGIAYEGLGRAQDASLAFSRGLTASRQPDERVLLYRGLGDISFQHQDWPRALEAYRSALALHPDDAGLLRQAARASYEIKNYAFATETMRHLLSLDSNAADRIWLANALVAQKNLPAAQLEFSRVLSETRDEAELVPAYRSLIEISRQRQDNAEAIRLTKSLLKLHDSEPDRRTLLTLIEQQKDYRALAEELQRYLAKTGEPPARRYDAYLKLGNVYEILQQDENAAAAYSGALGIYRRVEPLDALSEVWERAGHLKDAIALAAEAVQLQPSSDLNLRLGILCEKAGEANDALAYLESAVQPGATTETLHAAFSHEGYIYAAQHRYREARTAFDQALRSGGEKEPELNAAMARVSVELGDYKTSLGYLEMARTSGSDPDLLRLTALARVKTGNLDEGAAIYTKLLSVYPHPSPEAEQTQTELARLEGSRQNFTAASDHFMQAFTESGEKHSQLLLEAAQSAFQAGKWSSAVALYTRFADRPDTPATAKTAAWQGVGYACMNAGDFRSAVPAFRKVLESSPDNALAHRNLAFALYRQQEWKASLGEFLVSLRTGRDSQTLAGAARCYKELNKPGLAIYYFNQVQ